MMARKRWWVVGFISALAFCAIAKAFGLHPGETSDPVSAAIFMALLAWLAFLYAWAEDRRAASKLTEEPRG